MIMPIQFMCFTFSIIQCCIACFKLRLIQVRFFVIRVYTVTDSDEQRLFNYNNCLRSKGVQVAARPAQHWNVPGTLCRLRRSHECVVGVICRNRLRSGAGWFMHRLVRRRWRKRANRQRAVASSSRRRHKGTTAIVQRRRGAGDSRLD